LIGLPFHTEESIETKNASMEMRNRRLDNEVCWTKGREIEKKSRARGTVMRNQNHRQHHDYKNKEVDPVVTPSRNSQW